MEYQIINNKTENKYEIHTEGHLAYIQYEITGNEIALTHTIVPKELGGRGLATQMLKLVLADIEKLGLKVVPVCSFVVKYLEKQANS